MAGSAVAETPLYPTLVEVRNRSARTITCVAQVAHWFSTELGSAAPDGQVRADLRSDPVTGTVFILNDSGDRLPVEAAWCGFAGAAWETRSPLALERRRGEPAADIKVSCDADDGRLRCH
ncbi:hypothetical protein N825_08880 [Skermanella stibiiresistens SB22]|uniref:Uncharacterized protein n=2 Tax=Skermanella TaxID=204447 RepID=W9H5T6_9PROT|nr:hypothetical protein N825_08880 [Skermanella stibiiresistens SB22]